MSVNDLQLFKCLLLYCKYGKGCPRNVSRYSVMDQKLLSQPSSFETIDEDTQLDLMEVMEDHPRASFRVSSLPKLFQAKRMIEMEHDQVRHVLSFPVQRTVLKRKVLVLASLVLLIQTWSFAKDVTIGDYNDQTQLRIQQFGFLCFALFTFLFSCPFGEWFKIAVALIFVRIHDQLDLLDGL